MPFSFSTVTVPGLFVIEPRVIEDDRGFFFESYKESEFLAAGIDTRFVQDNHSLSRAGVVRGLHFQRPPSGQAKLVSVDRGRAWSVGVDIRKGSATFGRWYGVELSSRNRRMFYLPDGFAHGFASLEDATELSYKCGAEYDPASEGGIRWDDPDLGIAWPLGYVTVSAKDARLPYLRDIV